jgi:ribosome maturation protein SDO1
MADLNKSVIVRVKKNNKHYEILVFPEKAVDFKKGKSISINDVVVTDEIFYDAKKGIKASEKELEEIFGISDKSEICSLILKEAEAPTTVDMTRKDLEQKRNLIVNLIHRNVVDPSSGKPHPPQRISAAMDEAKVKIADNKTAEQQFQDIIHKIRPIIPIKFEIRELQIKVPAQYAGRAIPVIKQFGKLLSQNWESDGSLKANLEIPAGLQEEFELALNNLSKGTLEVRILNAR